jgi:hypothetical protein
MVLAYCTPFSYIASQELMPPWKVPTAMVQFVPPLPGKNSFFLERSGNVYENKEALWKKWKRSGNLIEKTDSYLFEAAMLLKTKGIRWKVTCSRG